MYLLNDIENGSESLMCLIIFFMIKKKKMYVNEVHCKLLHEQTKVVILCSNFEKGCVNIFMKFNKINTSKY